MERELTKTFLEEYEGGIDELKKLRFKNSLILLSKSLFALCDFIIFRKISTLPKNHTERFKILKEYSPEVYVIVDKIFDKYTDSYSKTILKDTCELMKNAIAKISDNSEIPEEIRRIIKKI